MMLRQSDLVSYWWTREIVTVGGDVPVKRFTNSILVVNIGAIPALVNGFPINPAIVPGTNGESWSIGGNFGEIVSEENLEILFIGAAGGRVFVQMKYYVDVKEKC